MTARFHSELPPSSSDKWLRCPAWRKIVAQHVALYGTSPSSEAAEEGTEAHSKFESHLRSTLPDRRSPGRRRPKVRLNGFTSAEPLAVSDPFYDPLLGPIEWVQKQPGELFVEERVDFGAIFGFSGLTGTCDVALVEPKRLTIADLKFGMMTVEVGTRKQVNPQLGCYLVGAINRFGPRETYRIAVLQPRAYHPLGPIRILRLSQEDVDWFLFELEGALEASYDPKARGNPGPWCRHYCPALGSCKAFRARSLKVLKETPL